LPYQRKWLADKSRFKIAMVARQCGKSKFMAAPERVASLVRGDLNPENEGPTAPRVGRRQPDISEVASRLRGALKNRR
jgi:hypothetical protein